MGPEVFGGIVLGGIALLFAAIWSGYHFRGGWVRAEELKRERAELERDRALAALAKEREAHEAFARHAHTVQAEEARARRLAADPRVGDLELARLLLGAAPAAPAAVPPGGEGAPDPVGPA